MTMFPFMRVRDGIADLVKVSESSYPMCSVCNQTKEHIKRRKSLRSLLFDDWPLLFCTVALEVARPNIVRQAVF